MNSMGCGCEDKSLGASKDEKGINPMWFVLGGAAGVGLWYLLKNAGGKTGGPGQTVAAPMPAIASPSRFADLQSVALRLDQVKTLYRSGYLSPEQAYAESEGLIAAANSFLSEEGERVSEVIAAILSFEVQIEDYMEMKRELAPGASSLRSGSAFA